MIYQAGISAKFVSRPNRFVAIAEYHGREVTAHVKNTGRCRELLVPGAEIYLEDFSSRPGKRKLLYDVIAVKKGNLLINMDSQAPNRVVLEALSDGSLTLPGMEGPLTVRPETVFGGSRFDFFIRDAKGHEGFLEVKGVTLENEGVASFPDAPTERGVKHLKELTVAAACGYLAYLLFVIQMEDVRLFTPNDKCHAAFGEALRDAAQKGVCILAHACSVTPFSLSLGKETEIQL